MKRGQGGKIFLILLLLAIGTVLWSCSEDRVRFRLTYAVETPSGSISESHVLETWRKQGGGMRGRYNFGFRGEAAVINLGPDKLLFSILKLNDPSLGSDGMMWLPQQAYGTELKAQCLARIPAGGRCNIQDGDRSGFKQRTLSPSLYPMLVTFTDINDPKTVKLVDPDDLDGTMGLCSDSTGLKDESAPWRAAGMQWRIWRDMQAWENSRAETGAKIGLPDDVSAALMEFDILTAELSHHTSIETLIRKQADQARKAAVPERAHDLQRLFTHNERRQWARARFDSFKSQTTETRRDSKSDCHRLKSISVEITDEKVTVGAVEQVLGWLGEYYDKNFDGQKFETVYATNRLANSLASGAFKAGKNN